MVVYDRRKGHGRAGSMEQLLAAKEIVVACGSGGVGKTTTAASVAAMAAVRMGGRVLVLTVDPARRLANALGLEGFGNIEKPVPASAFTDAGVTPRGELWAAMLDTKQSWDNLVMNHAPDKDTAQRILDNPLYQNVSGRFVQSHDYIAMERLFEIHTGGQYDLIVVDTPPTRNALDLLEAPKRMADFFSSRFLRLLIAPYRSRLVNMASRPFYQVADRILGSQFLQDIAEFFILFQTMYAGFVQRAEAVDRLLHDRRTTFIVVSTLESAPLHEAEFFVDALRDKKFHLGAVVLNKVLPAYLLDTTAAKVAERMMKDGGAIADQVAARVDCDRELVERVLVEIGENFLRFQLVAQREAEQQAELAVAPEVVAPVPYFESDIYDLKGLLQLGEQIWS
jgi:anion-transporting  ArsA/GET3 family ATPase